MSDRAGLVIVTFQSRRTLPGLLDSLHEHEPALGGVVVDNASPDGPPVLDRRSAGRFRVLSLPANVGFGAACNAGAALLGDRWGFFVFLNPDIRLAGPSLSQLVDRMSERPQVGLASGPLVDQEGQRIPAAWGTPSAWRVAWRALGWQSGGVRRLAGRVLARGPFVSGASAVRDEMRVEGHVLGGATVARAECFRGLGGFDDGFFMYGEDADLCARARAAGWEVWVLPAVPMVHEEGTSSEGVGDDRRRQWRADGTRRYADKHLGPARARLVRSALRLGHGAARRG